MFYSQPISVYVLMRQRISALGVQSVLSNEKDMEVLVLTPNFVVDLRLVAHFRPDVVITDAHTCSRQSARALARIKESGATKFLFLCSSATDDSTDILTLAADGVIAKSSPAASLAAAVRSLVCGLS